MHTHRHALAISIVAIASLGPSLALAVPTVEDREQDLASTAVEADASLSTEAPEGSETTIFFGGALLQQGGYGALHICTNPTDERYTMYLCGGGLVGASAEGSTVDLDLQAVHLLRVTDGLAIRSSAGISSLDLAAWPFIGLAALAPRGEPDWASGEEEADGGDKGGGLAFPLFPMRTSVTLGLEGQLSASEHVPTFVVGLDAGYSVLLAHGTAYDWPVPEGFFAQASVGWRFE